MRDIEEPRARVLIIDDDPFLRRALTRLLKQWDVDVMGAPPGFGLLNLIADYKPSLVILDVLMPVLDGPSVVELIRSDENLGETRIVLCSSLDEDELAARAQSCRADAYIAKSHGPVEMVRKLRPLLGPRQALSATGSHDD